MKSEKCPVEQALQVIGGKWKIPIIHHLNEKPHRFGKLKSRLTKVTQQMLSKQLKEMETQSEHNVKTACEKWEYALRKIKE